MSVIRDCRLSTLDSRCSMLDARQRVLPRSLDEGPRSMCDVHWERAATLRQLNSSRGNGEGAGNVQSVTHSKVFCRSGIVLGVTFQDFPDQG